MTCDVRANPSCSGRFQSACEWRERGRTHVEGRVFSVLRSFETKQPSRPRAETYVEGCSDLVEINQASLYWFEREGEKERGVGSSGPE